MLPLLPSQLPVSNLVIGTGTGHHAETAIGPQLPLGTKPMRGLQDAQQFRRPNRSHRRNLTQSLPHLVLLALCQQVSPDFLAQASQRIQLLVVQLCPPVYSWFVNLSEPLRPMPRAI